jgi:glycerol-3-phosphate acyltransferase PlsY
VIALVELQGLPVSYDVYAIGSVALIWIFHHDNIARLLRGTERRIEWRR